MLLVEDTCRQSVSLAELDSASDHMSSILTSFPALRRRSEELMRRVRTVEPGEVSSVYVGQRELAVVTPEDDIEVVGSDSATTCHVVILRVGDVTGVGHVDTHTQDMDHNQLLELVEAVRHRSLSSHRSHSSHQPNFEVSIFGGYRDEAGVSRRISEMILRSLEQHREVTFVLTHLCCAHINTDGARPLVLGGGVEVRSGEVFCAEFTRRLPHMDIRALRLHSSQPGHQHLGRLSLYFTLLLSSSDEVK